MTKAAELAKMGEVLTNSQIGGRRNIVINGAMQVAQRATSVTGLGDDNDEGYPTVDRFKVQGNAGAGRFTMTQESVTDLPGFPECIKLDCTTADTSIAAAERLFIQTKFEGQDLQGIKKGTSAAEAITVSFYAKANASFKFVVALFDVDNDRYAGSTFDVTSSWQRFIVTFPADADDGSSPFDNDNADSLNLRFFIHGGSNYTSGTLSSTFANVDNTNTYDSNADSFYSSTDNNFFLTGVQLEVGSVATPFEHRSYGEELALCQRYYQRKSDGMATSSNTTTALSSFEFRHVMRANPTFSQEAVLGITNGSAWDKTQSSVSAAIIAGRVSTFGVQLAFGNFSSLTQYQPVAINNSGGDILIDAEL
jgi:hypothetical protein